SAYLIDTNGGAGATVAIVDAQDTPNAEADLAVYRTTYGLPPCTTANGCFKKVNQNGAASPLPAPDKGWATEIMLDLEMASATCPKCKILLVEATTASMDDLGTAVNTAAAMGATVISNSYGGPEDATIADGEKYFNHPGIGVFVAAGDSGFGAMYPASSQYVIAVGGTALTKSTTTTRGWVETVWGSWLSVILGGTGSGCSKYITKPSWQEGTGCALRPRAGHPAARGP